MRLYPDYKNVLRLPNSSPTTLMLGLMLYSLYLWFSFFHCCHALMGNVTIDDTYGDVLTGTLPAYAPDANWKPSPADDMNATRLHYGSTHGLFGTGNISLAFTGTVIYVYFVVDPLAGSDISFVLDGEAQHAKRYERNATTGAPVYLYNQLVFKSEALTKSPHNLRVIVTSTSIGCLYFDYAIYSSQTSEFDEGPQATQDASPTRRRVNLGAIIGPSVAGALAIALCWWYLLRKRPGRQRSRGSRAASGTRLSMRMMDPTRTPGAVETITPFTAHPSPDLDSPAPKDSFYQWQKPSRADGAGRPPPHQAAPSSEAVRIRGEPEESGQTITRETEPPPY